MLILLRCIPQIHGASWQVLNYVKEKLEIEMNAATDNPLIFDDGEVVISGGNFHGQPIAFAMDFLKIGIAELANVSERRIERLVNPQLNEGLTTIFKPTTWTSIRCYDFTICCSKLSFGK